MENTSEILNIQRKIPYYLESLHITMSVIKLAIYSAIMVFSHLKLIMKQPFKYPRAPCVEFQPY
jgi:hypothetical protein